MWFRLCEEGDTSDTFSHGNQRTSIAVLNAEAQLARLLKVVRLQVIVALLQGNFVK